MNFYSAFGFFATMIFSFFAITIILLYTIAVFTQYSQGKYLFGKPMKEEEKKQAKIRYGTILLLLIMVVIYTLFINNYGSKYHKNQPVSQEEQPVASDNRISVDYGIYPQTEANIQIVQEVFNHFAENVNGTSIVDSIEVSLNHYEPLYYLYRQEDYGWGANEIEIQIKINDHDNIFYDDMLVAGHTLYYFFGGGERPRIVMMKDESALFYGIGKSAITSGTDTFIDDPFYKIIDGLSLE